MHVDILSPYPIYRVEYKSNLVFPRKSVLYIKAERSIGKAPSHILPIRHIFLERGGEYERRK